MIEEARKDHKFTLRESSKKEALNFYKKNNNEYKTELINELKDEKITFAIMLISQIYVKVVTYHQQGILKQ